MSQRIVQGYEHVITHEKHRYRIPVTLGWRQGWLGGTWWPQSSQSALIWSDASSKCVCVKSLQICPILRPHGP